MQECFTIAWPAGSPCGDPAYLDLARESRVQAASRLCPRERRSLTNLIRGTGGLLGREAPRLFWGRKEWQQDWKEVADRLIPERFTIELQCCRPGWDDQAERGRWAVRPSQHMEVS